MTSNFDAKRRGTGCVAFCKVQLGQVSCVAELVRGAEELRTHIETVNGVDIGLLSTKSLSGSCPVC